MNNNTGEICLLLHINSKRNTYEMEYEQGTKWSMLGFDNKVTQYIEQNYTEIGYF